MTNTVSVGVNLSSDYSITIGEDLWEDATGYMSQRFSGRKALLVLDENVETYHGNAIRSKLHTVFEEVSVFKVGEGEQSKSMEVWRKLVNFALVDGIERGTPLLAFGGGVTGDLAGFAAASLLRGIPLIHFPTTVLAMVDSSIGGKTGINHSTGKNLIGAFYQPDAVFADTGFLTTLDEKEWINGFAEILKYGAIKDPRIFEESHPLINSRTFTPSPEWNALIHKSAAIKAEVVQADTLEAGSRAYLNFGHTFGHALEKTAGYGALSHGEAVFAGMIAATYVSEKLGAPVDPAQFAEFKALYPFSLKEFSSRIVELTEAMYSDKKVKEGKLHLVLLKDWGEPVLREGNEALIREAWNFVINQFS